METLFLSIQQQIAGNVSELRYIDEDYGQLNTEEDTYPVTFPCALIQVEEIDWKDLGAGKQQGAATVRVKLAIDCYHDTHHTSGTSDKAAERMQFYNRLHKVVHLHHERVLFTPLKRAKSVFYSLPGGVKVYEGVYTCQVFDLT
jgi:hypothetical protein